MGSAAAGMDAAAELQKVASMRRDSGGSRPGPSAWWRAPDDAFSCSSSRREEEDDEEALRWAALERLPTSDRVRRAILPLGGDGDGHGGGEAAPQVVDVLGLGPRERRALLERLVRVADEDNERFLLKIKERIQRCVHMLLYRYSSARTCFTILICAPCAAVRAGSGSTCPRSRCGSST